MLPKWLKSTTTTKLDEGLINSWGYDLLSANHLPEAISVFKFNVSLNPNSGNAYDSLAEAYMKTGDKQQAVEFYKKSLEKDPSNENAKEKIKDLEQSPSKSATGTAN